MRRDGARARTIGVDLLGMEATIAFPFFAPPSCVLYADALSGSDGASSVHPRR